jgi:hypothetical protein
MDYKDLSPIKKQFVSLSEYMGMDPMPIKELELLPDPIIKTFIKTLEDLMDKYNRGGIVSLNQMTRPIGYR